MRTLFHFSIQDLQNEGSVFGPSRLLLVVFHLFLFILCLVLVNVHHFWFMVFMLSLEEFLLSFRD